MDFSKGTDPNAQDDIVTLCFGVRGLSATFEHWYIKGEISAEEEKQYRSKSLIRHDEYLVIRKNVPQLLELYNELCDDRGKWALFNQLIIENLNAKPKPKTNK